MKYLDLKMFLPAVQEKCLNTFYMSCLCGILSISWTDKVANSTVVMEKIHLI